MPATDTKAVQRFFKSCRDLAEILPKFVENLPSHSTPTFDREASVASHRWAKIFREGWGGGGPPQGVCNPPPTEGVQGVLNWTHIVLNQSSRPTTNGQAPDGKLKFLDQGS